MNFEITHDIDYIRECLTNEYVWENSMDDSFKDVSKDLFFPKMDGITYVKAGDFGLLMAMPINFITHDIHIALLPNARGMAKTICQEAIEWVFENNKERPLRLTASIPEFNKHAIKLARDVGMEFIGVNKMSFLKNGKLFNQLLFGLSRRIE